MNRPGRFFRALSQALAAAGHPTAARWLREWEGLVRCPPRDVRAILENLTAGERAALSPKWQAVVAGWIARGA